MVATWTEAFSSFTPAGTGWQNYDLFTNKSVPKGAIAYIVIASVNDAAARTVGVRTDGSALNRYVKLHESEAGGACTADFYVKCDASTGLIETYADNVTGITFYLLGYWTGTDFTELFATISPTTASTWQDKDIFTSNSVPKGSVCQVMCNNRVDGAATTMGVRTDGSGLSRYHVIHEAESATVETTDVTSFTMCVKSDASTGIIEVYASSLTSDVILLGYFDSKLTYVENFQTGSVSATGWTDWDLTSYLDQDGRVVEVVCGNAATGVEYDFGCRKNGSGLARYVLIHESETNGVNGFTAPTETDAGGIVELYASNAASEYFRYVGYYKPTEKDVVVTDAMALSEFIKTNPNYLWVYDSIGLSDITLLPWLMGKDASAATVATSTMSTRPVGQCMRRRIWYSNNYYRFAVCDPVNNRISHLSSTNKSSWGNTANIVDYSYLGDGYFADYIPVIAGYSDYSIWAVSPTGAGSTYCRWARGHCENNGTYHNTGSGDASKYYNGIAAGVCLPPDGLPVLAVPIADDVTIGYYYNSLGDGTGTWTNMAVYHSVTAPYFAVVRFGSAGRRFMSIRAISGSPNTLMTIAYDNGSWLTDSTLCSNLPNLAYWAALEYGGDIYACYCKFNGSTYDVIFRKWTSAGGWESEVTVRGGYASAMPCSIGHDPTNGSMYVIWAEGANIYVKRRTSGGTLSDAESLWTMGTNYVADSLSCSDAAGETGEVGVTWLEGTSGSWTIKAAWFRVAPIAKIVTDALYISDAITSPMHMIATDSILDTDSIRKSPENWIISESLALLEFSLNYAPAYMEWDTSDYGSSNHQYPCCYQVHIFRAKESYERNFVFCHDGRYFKHTSSSKWYGTETSTTYFLIEDHGAGLGDDKKDDAFWDAVNQRWRTAFLTGHTVYIRTGTPAYPGSPPVYVSWSGQTSAYTSAGETQDLVCCAYADSTYWLGLLETNGGSDKYPKVKNSMTWGSFGSNITIDATNGNCSAFRILNGGGPTMKTTFLYVTGSGAGSYILRGAYYNQGVCVIGAICTDLYSPETWAASSDEKGNVYIVWAFGSSGQGVKYVRINNGAVGTIKTIATSSEGSGRPWSYLRVATSVDKRIDRQLVIYSWLDDTGYAAIFYVGMTGEAPYTGKTNFGSWATGYWAYISAEPNCGTYDVWVSAKHSAYGNYSYLLNLPPVVQKSGTDSIGLADIANLVQAVAQIVLDAIGLADLPLVGKDLTSTADVIGLVDAIFRGKEVVETDSIGVVDVINVLRNMSIYITDALSLSDEAPIQKFKTTLDSIELLDAGTRDKALIEIENLLLTDAVFRGKEVIQTDSIGLTESLFKLLTGLVIESIGISDAGLRNKPFIPIADSIVVDDQGFKVRHITISESIGMDDGPRTDKDLTVASESIILSDQILRDKLLIVIMDALALDDMKLVNKTNFVLDTLNLLESVFAGRQIVVTDGISLTDLDLAGKALKIIEAMMLNDQELINKGLIGYDYFGLSDTEFRDKAIIILESTGLLDEDLRPLRSIPIDDNLLLATEVLALTKALLSQDNIALSEVVIRVRTGIQVLLRLRGELTAADIKGERRDGDFEGETEKKVIQGRETKKYWQRGLKE